MNQKEIWDERITSILHVIAPAVAINARIGHDEMTPELTKQLMADTKSARYVKGSAKRPQ